MGASITYYGSYSQKHLEDTFDCNRVQICVPGITKSPFEQLLPNKMQPAGHHSGNQSLQSQLCSLNQQIQLSQNQASTMNNSNAYENNVHKVRGSPVASSIDTNLLDVTKTRIKQISYKCI